MGFNSVDLKSLIQQGMAELQTGPFGTMLHASSYQEQGTPVIAVLHIGDNSLVHKDLPRINLEDAERLERYRLRPDDIIFARKGAVDRRALVKATEEGWIQGSDCIRLRFLSKNINPQFVSYYLGTPSHKSWIVQNSQGATMPSLNQEILSRIEIPFPDIDEQKAIAAVLSALDDKIELNRRMNETLEAMAKALFKSWFVDFDPVRAKAEGRQPEGLAPEIAALFPDGFEDSELGEIPAGWEAKPLDQIAEYLNGLALQKYPPKGEEYLPVIKIAELRQGVTDKSGQASPDIDPRYIVQDGDVLFSWSGSLVVMLWCGGKGALNQHLFKVTSHDYPKWFYYLWTLYYLHDFQHIAESKATTMGHIQRHHLSERFALTPPPNLFKGMSHVMEPLLDRYIQSNLQAKTLSELRDNLLPKLMSGEVRVREAEALVESQL